MKLFIAGATSDLGNRVVSQLVRRYGKQMVTCLVRNTSNIDYLKGLGVVIKIGDVTQPETFQDELGPDTVYIDMTHPKYYSKSINTVKNAGTQRAFFVTTTGIYSKYNHCSDVYKLGEASIKESGIKYTILRPSMIYGTERDRNMTKLLCYLDKYPIFPIFGKGDCYMQPVYVQDLADGIFSAIDNKEISSLKEYNLCGPSPLTYLELLRIASESLSRKVRFFHIPYWLAVGIVTIAEKIPAFPIKKEQVLRMLEDKSFDITDSVRELNYTPRNFNEGIKEEIKHLKKIGLLSN